MMSSSPRFRETAQVEMDTSWWMTVVCSQIPCSRDLHQEILTILLIKFSSNAFSAVLQSSPKWFIILPMALVETLTLSKAMEALVTSRWKEPNLSISKTMIFCARNISLLKWTSVCQKGTQRWGIITIGHRKKQLQWIARFTKLSSTVLNDWVLARGKILVKPILAFLATKNFNRFLLRMLNL